MGFRSLPYQLINLPNQRGKEKEEHCGARCGRRPTVGTAGRFLVAAVVGNWLQVRVPESGDKGRRQSG